MAMKKANQFKERAPKSNDRKKKGRTGKERSWKLPAFLSDERFRKITGFFLLLLSVYLFFAFTSYFIAWFTWGKDDILAGMSFKRILTDTDIDVHNWTGRIGAAVAHQAIKEWIGISAYFIVLMLFLWGMRLMINVTLVPLGRTFRMSLTGILWISVMFGFILGHEPMYSILGGVFGYEAALWLNGTLGKIGTVFLLVFILVSFLIIAGWLPVIRRKKEKDLSGEEGTKANRVVPEDQYNTVEFSVEDEEDAIGTSGLPARDSSEDAEEDQDNAGEEAAGKEGIELTIEERKEEKKADGYRGTLDTAYDPTLDLPDYKMPRLDLLDDYGTESFKVAKEELEQNKDRIVETLNHYQIQIDKIKATIGPTVTLYEIIPAPGVRISRIRNLEDDIALSLSAKGIRIIAPIPGKGTIGIEVPNQNPEIVSVKSLLSSERFQSSTFELPIALGKTISNESYIADLAKMPHILMAGATGQGKSVGLNAIITSLLYKKHPAQLKFVLVDPKKVELTLFSKIERHFLAKLPDSEEAIITDTRRVVRTLNSLCIEMDHRYELLKDAQVRNIKEYNTKFIARRLNPEEGHNFMPYIVLVVDEFADLIMTAGKEIENPLTRLAQLARATGIHLIIATQRPSVNIITGTIKANFPARIAFRVIQKVDSRTILDSGGADQLIGRGDMLLATGSELIRLQCAFVDTPEVEKVTDFIGSQRAYPDAFHLPEYEDEEGNGSMELDAAFRDDLFEDAARIIVQHQQGSTSLLQRKLKLGYNRAGRIIDQLEAAGIVGPFEGSKAREVMITDLESLEHFLDNINNKSEI